jgi:F-type H+-transporting ATPase subunit epsilon
MAHATFPVEVLTPEGAVFNHAPVLATLEPTELRLYRSESDIVRFAQAEGYIQVADNRALLLVEEAHTPDQLDAASLRERLQEAERELESAGEDTEKRRVAASNKLRWERFLLVAEGD